MNKSNHYRAVRYLLLIAVLLSQYLAGAPTQPAWGQEDGVAAPGFTIYLPVLTKNPTAAVPPPPVSGIDWPQIGHDAQRTNYTSEQVDAPYCYTWKWYEAPLASRAQPVVAQGRLVIGSMDGKLYARNATTGAPLWTFTTGGPIRNSAGIANGTVVTSSHDGYTYALNAADGDLEWKTLTGASATAPLIDSSRNWVYVASTNGILTALSLATGAVQWTYDSGAAILTTPSLSADNQTVFLGNEAIYALAVNASTGSERWRARLQGQSLADRYPVVSANTVMYRSQPLDNFHTLLHEGDDVLDQAGALVADWAADWAKVKPNIVNFLTQQVYKQTFFTLSTTDGSSRGIAPILYTYGNNDIPNLPVIRGNDIFVTYRARHGIQTDSGSIHVTTKYDAELGQMNPSTLDITGLRSTEPFYQESILEWRMTSDEPAMLTMGGNFLWVDNWERLGGINVSNGQMVHVGAVSNDWPECYTQCGPGTNNPVFPMSGSGAPYPFPSPRITEGRQRSGVVIANKMLYWRVVEGGLVGISHRAGSACPAPQVWTSTPGEAPFGEAAASAPASPLNVAARPLSDYVTLDLTAPVSNPPADLVTRLRNEVRAIVNTNSHLMPYYLERGFSAPYLWPYNVASSCSTSPCLPVVIYSNNGTHGNVYWQDPGELLYTLALAYPYLDPQLQTQAKTYMAAEMARYSPIGNLPWSGPPNPPPSWLVQGRAREYYEVPFRDKLNNWPPPAANITSLYALWLWSKNTGDWSYAQSHWSTVKSLFTSRSGSMLYYADIAGAIGYARMATHFGNTADAAAGSQAAVTAMQSGLNFDTFKQRAENDYLDPREMATGWSVPVYYGLTPEVGLYLREQLGGNAETYLLSKENGNSLHWWFLTRVGIHSEEGETSYISPFAAWSHFLGHAYIVGNNQATLRSWLDRPWSLGDLYSIQKIVATIQAAP